MDLIKRRDYGRGLVYKVGFLSEHNAQDGRQAMPAKSQVSKNGSHVGDRPILYSEQKPVGRLRIDPDQESEILR